MRSSFVRDVRDVHDGVIPVSENYPLVFATSGAGGSSFVLGPGYQVIESGQVPQALPGQALPHDGSPPPASNPQAAAASPSPSSVGPQSAIMAPSSSPLAASSSSQQAGSSIESASVSSALPSGPMSVQSSSAATFATLSSSPPNSVPPTSSAGVAPSAVSTSTFLPSSTFGTASSSSNIAPAVAFSSSTNSHGASFWAAIALVSIAGVATIITLFMWWLRVRARTHRRPWESRWPWGRAESYRFPEDAISSSGTSASWWQPQGGDRDRDVGEPRHSMSTSTGSDLPSSRGTSSSTSSSAGLHLPPLTALSPFAHGPYPTVRPLPLELRRSDTSVPGLMQDVGALHVANLVAGDILTSGDESSRPPTALDDVVGTPREDRAVFRPRYLSLNGSGGLDVPWITTPPAAESPTKPQPPGWSGPPVSVGAGASAAVPLPLDHNHGRWKERLERSSASHDLPTGTIEAWRDSLRSNIVNALGVFTSPAPAPATAHPSITAYDWQQHPAVARAPSATSASSKAWTLEETRDGAGIVHIRGVPDPTSIESSASASRSGNGGGGALPRASLVPPRLPHLPPMPSVPRTSGARTASTKRQYGSRSRRRRPCSAVVRRASSAATSVGSDMSRAEGSSAVVARWARLSEKEAAARRALRQRRIKSGRSGGGVRIQRTRTRGSGSGSG